MNLIRKTGGDLLTHREALFTPDMLYRFKLKISWNGDLPSCVFIGLNPSTADEMKDDPTLRKVQGFARRWGCGSVTMLNLFAWRATDPRDMRKAACPICPPPRSATFDGWEDPNTALIRNEVTVAAGWGWPVIAAWGANGKYRDRGPYMARMLHGYLKCLRLTKDGHPEHPLYVPYATEPIPYEWRTSEPLVSKITD